MIGHRSRTRRDDTFLLTGTTLEQLFEGISDGIVVSDGDGSILFANRTAAELSGYSREELAGTQIEDLIPVAARSGHRRHRELYFHDRPALRPMGTRLGLAVLTKDRRALPVDIALSRIEGMSGPAVVAAIREVRRPRLEEDRSQPGAQAEVAALLERERLAKELRQGAIQAIFAAGLDVQGAAARISDPKVNERLDAVVERLDGVIHELRSYIYGLGRQTDSTLMLLQGGRRGLE